MLIVPEGPEPLFQRVASALNDSLARGALFPGDLIWGSRKLSESLSVSRSTIEAAYDLLCSRGVLERRAGSGTYVASAPVPSSTRAGPGFDFDSPQTVASSSRSSPLLLSGAPVPNVLPAREVARALRRAHARRGKSKPDPLGQERLRALIAAHLRTERGLRVSPDDVMVFPRVNEPVRLVLRAVMRPDRSLGIAEFEHTAMLGVVRALEGRVVVNAVAAEPKTSQRLGALWVQPFSHYPTTQTLTPAQRAHLLERASRERLAILEADYSHWLTLDGKPPPPLAASDPTQQVILLGTFTHLLALDLQLSFIVAPPVFLEALARWRSLDRWREDTVALEFAVAELIEEGVLRRTLRKMTEALRSRRDALVAAMHSRLGSSVSFAPPTAGAGVWARVSPDIDVERWAEAALTLGVRLRTGRHYAPDGRPCPFIKVGFGAHDPALLAEGVGRLATALRTRR